MSCQRMPVVEQVLDDPSGYARIELAIATTLPSAQAARVFLWLATYPWRAVTWLGPGHSVRWYHEPATFPLGGDEGYGAVLLLDSPGSLPGPEAPDLSGFTFGGDPVRWLWIVPITGAGPPARQGTRLGQPGQQARRPAAELGLRSGRYGS